MRGRMVRTHRYKYVAYSAGEQRERLADLQTDPGEMRNLIEEPGLQDEVQRHRALLAERCRNTGDGFQVPG
ncbi:MAG: DUF4976 domain-containing protein [Candidatus Brocadiia bacterium]